MPPIAMAESKVMTSGWSHWQVAFIRRFNRQIWVWYHFKNQHVRTKQLVNMMADWFWHSWVLLDYRNFTTKFGFIVIVTFGSTCGAKSYRRVDWLPQGGVPPSLLGMMTLRSGDTLQPLVLYGIEVVCMAQWNRRKRGLKTRWTASKTLAR